MNDRDYYLTRANQEDEAARSAASLAARWRHEELAFLYRSQADCDEPLWERLGANELVKPGDLAL